MVNFSKVSMSKKIILSILSILVVGCVILSIVAITAVVMISKESKTEITAAAPAATATETVIETPDAKATFGPTETVPSTTQSSTKYDDQMDQIQEEVMSYRGLKQSKPLTRALLTTDQLKDKVINDFFKDYTDEDVKDDVQELSTLGLLPAGFDLKDFYIKLYSEQIAGYYDNETKDMYVVSDEGFNGTERMTYSHEFTHVLQDQNYDIRDGLKDNEDYCKDHTEYCAAVTALIEGDATLSEQYWLYKYGTDKDKKQIQDFQNSYTSPVYDSAPAYMKQDFLFPYQYGLEFVSDLYMKNKWTAVDNAYKDPPVSTEQIMHPDKYPSDVPVKVSLPDFSGVLGKEWRLADDNEMGEWYSYLILAYGRDSKFQLDTDTAKTATDGWGGDHYAFYVNDTTGKSILVWESTWDTENDAQEYWDAVKTYATDRWGAGNNHSVDSVSWASNTDGQILMEHSGSSVLWMIAPTTDLKSKLLDELKFGE
jgi:hypothetical protein